MLGGADPPEVIGLGEVNDVDLAREDGYDYVTELSAGSDDGDLYERPHGQRAEGRCESAHVTLWRVAARPSGVCV